jgi:hypothetical protein
LRLGGDARPANAAARFVATWLEASAACSAVVGAVDLFHRIDLVAAIVAIVATVFCVMLTIQFPGDPVLSAAPADRGADAEGWARAVVRLVFLREMIQRTLTYPARSDRALRELITDLVMFRGSARRGLSGSARRADLPTELSYETRAFLDGTTPASVASLRVVVNELEGR